ncbi:MAG: hypothetical protein KAQ63_03550, partial [Candidatus Moranbacteria bacterium]|nr:hypothetical protein [Candidatus Moranbacteria bacterium]
MMKKKKYESIISKRILGSFKIIGIYLLVLTFFSSFIMMPGTNAGFLDQESSVGNELQMGTLDMELYSGQSSFSPSSRALDLKPGESVARDVYVGKLGSLPFRYGATVLKDDASCDVDLFEELNLRVYYNFYHTQEPVDSLYHQYRTMTTVYNGKLADFALNDVVPNRDDLQIPNANPHFDNRFYDEDEHWLYFQVYLSESVDDSLQMKSCSFDFNFEAWQVVNTDTSIGFTDFESLSSTISTGIWVEPDVPNPLGWNIRSES